MTEEFLHHCWKFRWLPHQQLKTTSGESLQIIKTGEHNFDSGPDFFNAKLKIGDTEWAGNIEIHLRSSDWEKHKHQTDKAYQNILLHVVYENDLQLLDHSGKAVPTLELKTIIDADQYAGYLKLKNSLDWIPCENSIHRAEPFVVSAWLDRVLVERLEQKSQIILDALQLNNNNWEETFYQQLARNFGFKINAVPFELLAKSLPNAILAKHKNSIHQIEAMLFGNAGMLDKQVDDKYLLTLQNEYQFLKHKYALKSIEAHLWKFLRLRPANFPTIRISQFAALVHRSEHLFSKILHTPDLGDLQQLLNVSASDYWRSHYSMQKPSEYKNKTLGKTAIDILIINTVVPFLFVYGKQKKQAEFIDRALAFLEQTPAEKNNISMHFSALGLNIKAAAQSQAVLQLKQKYCSPKSCLHCAIGNNLLKK